MNIKLNKRGWNVVTALGTLGLLGVIVLSGWMEAAL